MHKGFQVDKPPPLSLLITCVSKGEKPIWEISILKPISWVCEIGNLLISPLQMTPLRVLSVLLFFCDCLTVKCDYGCTIKPCYPFLMSPALTQWGSAVSTFSALTPLSATPFVLTFTTEHFIPSSHSFALFRI